MSDSALGEARAASPLAVSAHGATLSPTALVTLLVALLVASAAILIAHASAPVWDQGALLDSAFPGEGHVPSPARGFTSQLVVALWRLFDGSEGATLDLHVRLLAMTAYAVAATLLAVAMLGRSWLVAAFLLLLFSSRYPLLWLSSELFAGSLLCLTLWARVTARPPLLLGALLALLGLVKPDVMLVALALFAWWALAAPDRRFRTHLVAGLAGTLALCLLPGTLALGTAYFDTYGGGPGGRSFASFSQHYAALIAHFQIAPGLPDPWDRPEPYVQRSFPGAESMRDVLAHWPLYLEFVWLAVLRGLLRAGWVLNYSLLCVPLLFIAWRRADFRWSDAEKWIGLSFVGLLPFVLFAYPHVRYLARYFPLVLILMLAVLARVQHGSSPEERRLVRPLAGACLLAALLENLRRLAASLAALPPDGRYWFPD